MWSPSEGTANEMNIVYCVVRDAVEEKTFSTLVKVLTRLCEELQAAGLDSEDVQTFTLQLQLTAECFRAQRNSCVQSIRNQSLLRYLRRHKAA